MDPVGTVREAEADTSCRALVVIPSGDGCGAFFRRNVGGRPMAGFLAQLIVDTDPALRITRSERTQTAAALYARTDRLSHGRRRA